MTALHAPPATNSRTKWLMLALSYIVLLVCFIPYIGWTIKLIEIQEEFNLTSAQAGLLASITALVGGLTLPFAGVIGDRWGTKKIILLGLAVSVVGQLAFAYAGIYSVAMLGRALCGLGVGLLFVGPYTMAVNWFEREQQNGIALGIMFTSDGVGTAFALYLFALVLTAYGWRNGSVIRTVLLAITLVIAALFLKDAPTEAEHHYDTFQESHHEHVEGTLTALRHRNVFVASAFFIGEWGIFAVVAVWMPTILIENAGWAPETAGLFSSLYVVIGMITAITFGLISDRLGHRKRLIVFAGAAMAISMAGLTFSLINGNYTAVAIWLPIVGLGVYTGMPLALALATESVPSNANGAANGLILGVGFIVGGFVYPYAIGLVKDSTGDYNVGFIAMTIATLVLNFGCALIASDQSTIATSNDG